MIAVRGRGLVFVAAAAVALALVAVLATRPDSPLTAAEPRTELRAAGDLYAPELAELEVRLGPEAWAALERRPRRFVRGEVVHAGRSHAAKIRLKGHRSMRRLDDKPAFKLEFTEPEGLAGERSLALNNLVEDPTGLREVLAYRLMAAVGLAVPRTRYATVRVNGVDKGLYLMVEPLDEAFLAHRFETGGDLLYEGEYGCDVRPSDVEGFDLDAGADPDGRLLSAFSRAAAGEASALFDPERGPLDVNAFVTYVAASTAVGDFDGYRHSHNYYLHYHAADKKWRFIPWGLDRAFKRRLTIDDSQGLLAQRCFRDAACKLAYVRALASVATTFASLALPELASATAKQLEESEGLAPLGAVEQAGIDDARAALKRFLEERPTELRAQLRCIDAGGRELDHDGDGYGCTDCDDRDARVHPGAGETCDGVDNDCTGLVDDAPACSCQPASVLGDSYELCALPMPWAQAEQFCADKGMTLASVTSKAVSKKLYQKARRLDRQRWWIGLSDREREGEFRWSDGRAASFAYWGRREPDNGSCNEDCAALEPDKGGKWHDTHCGQHRPFICGPVSRDRPGASAEHRAR